MKTLLRMSLIFLVLLSSMWVGRSVGAQVGDDINVGGEIDRSEGQPAAPEAAPEGGETPEAVPETLVTGEQPAGTPQLQETFVTVKEGWQEKGASRIYDAVDGKMIINDVSIRPFRLTRREAVRKYDNGTHGDEVPRDGVPSRILVNDTDFMGPRTAANYDELKGILFTIGNHPDGPQRFFDQLMVSLDWDGKEVPWDPNVRTGLGVYRLTSLERRMYAFIIRDSLEIMRAYQTADGKDLTPYEDRVSPPSGLGSNSLQAKRQSNGISTWSQAISSGEKLALEREMLSALAGTEIEGASWFPGGVTAVQLLKIGAPIGGGMGGLGLGAAAFAGYPGAGLYGGGYGLGGGGYGYPAGGGGYGYPGGGGAYGYPGGGGAYGAYTGAAGLNPRGVNIRPPGGAYDGLGGGISPLGGSLGFAF